MNVCLIHWVMGSRGLERTVSLIWSRTNIKRRLGHYSDKALIGEFEEHTLPYSVPRKAFPHGFHPIEEVKFNVVHIAKDTVGGKLFIEKMGVSYAKQFMSEMAAGIWDFVFWQSVNIREKVQKINLFIDHPAEISNYYCQVANYVYEIHLSAEHIEKFKDSVQEEIQMLLTYEIAGILQYTANGHTPLPLRKGIATYIVLLFGHKPSRWANYGEGERWNHSSDVTGQFLWYCSCQYPHFIENLNKKMILYYNDDYFADLSHKTIDELWREYKEQTVLDR